MNDFDLTLIGGGCAGTLVLLQLAQQSAGSLRVAVVDPTAELGRGLAYSTENLSHLLNVPAFKMSAFPESPRDFVDWLELQHPEFSEFSFVPRRIYGDYLVDRLSVARRLKSISLEHLRVRAKDIEPLADQRFAVTLSSGSPIRSKAVVLAIGTPESSWPAVFNEAVKSAPERFILNPWNIAANSALLKSRTVCILGTGLTAIDAFLSLAANRFSGRVLMLSRHGLLPRAHRPDLFTGPGISPPELPISLRQMVRWLRKTSLTHDWRLAVDSLRPLTARLWQGLTLAERGRFMRYLRSYWDVHRHRAAPEIGAKIERARGQGRLSTVAGKVTNVRISSGGVSLDFQQRGNPTETLQAEFVVNCTGFGAQNERDSLVGRLHHRGVVDAEDFGLGYRRNQAISGFYLVGSIRRGELWESIAVPELRDQAREIVGSYRLRFGPLLGTAVAPSSGQS